MDRSRPAERHPLARALPAALLVAALAGAGCSGDSRGPDVEPPEFTQEELNLTVDPIDLGAANTGLNLARRFPAGTAGAAPAGTEDADMRLWMQTHTVGAPQGDPVFEPLPGALPPGS